jgi:hypothetical protein
LEMALVGWASYVFFVPLAYFGARLTADDEMTAKALRVVTVCGGVVGAETVLSAILGSSAPAFLQPIVPAAGVHTFNTTTVYLAPSVFATAEEASEQLLIALFAWFALAHLDRGRFRRIPSIALGALIVAGLLFTARRADIYVAALGIAAVVAVDRLRAPAIRARRMSAGMGPTLFIAGLGSACLALALGGGTLRSFLVSGSAGDRVALMLSMPSSGSPIGQGPGTSTQGGIGASNTLDAMSGAVSSYVMNGRVFTAVEGGLGKTWVELGILGVLLYAAVFVSALLPAIPALRRMDGVGTALTALSCALGVIFLKGHQSLDNPLVQPLFWLVVGGIWGRMRVMSADGGRPRQGQYTVTALSNRL